MKSGYPELVEKKEYSSREHVSLRPKEKGYFRIRLLGLKHVLLHRVLFAYYLMDDGQMVPLITAMAIRQTTAETTCAKLL